MRNGQLWGPTTYLGFLAEKRIHCGAFADARACLEEIDRIWDLFQYDLAKTNHYYLNTLQLLEQGDLTKTIEAADAYYEETPEDRSTSSPWRRRRRPKPSSAISTQPSTRCATPRRS